MFARPPVRWKNFLLSLAISWTLSDLFLMNSQDIFFLDIFSWILFLSASLLTSLSCDAHVPFSSHLLSVGPVPRSWRTTSCWHCEISRSRSKGPNQLEDSQMEGACKLYPLVNKHRPWQIGVGRLVSINNWWFSGSMFIYQRVHTTHYCTSIFKDDE